MGRWQAEGLTEGKMRSVRPLPLHHSLRERSPSPRFARGGFSKTAFHPYPDKFSMTKGLSLFKRDL